jgi:hypothetical protein
MLVCLKKGVVPVGNPTNLVFWHPKMPKKNFISENPKIPVASFEIPCFLP